MWGQGQRSGVGATVSRADYEHRNRSTEDEFEVIFVEKHKTSDLFGPATITLDRNSSTYMLLFFSFTAQFGPPSTAALFPRSFASRNDAIGLDITKVAQQFSNNPLFTSNLVRKTNESLAFQAERSGHIDADQKKAVTRIHSHLEGTAISKYCAQSGAIAAIHGMRVLSKVQVSIQLICS